MRWLSNLLTSHKRKDVSDELAALRARMDELAAHNALMMRMNGFDDRLLSMQTENDQKISGINQKIINIELLLPKRGKVGGWQFFKPLEEQVTANGVKWAFGGSVLIMFFIVVFFSFTGKSKEAVDAAAYLFPCCAAIVAGLTVYLEHSKGLLFIVSLFLLFLGIDMFLAGLQESAEPIAYTTFFTVGLVDIGLIFMGCISVKKAYLSTENKGDRWRRVGSEILAYGVVFLVLISLSTYAGLFLFKNYPCYHSGSQLTDCKGVWRWPLPTVH